MDIEYFITTAEGERPIPSIFEARELVIHTGASVRVRRKDNGKLLYSIPDPYHVNTCDRGNEESEHLNELNQGYQSDRV